MTFAKSLIAALLVFAASPALADPVMWKVVGPRATVSIFGVVPPSAVGESRWRTPALDQAAAGAQELWFEAPLGMPNPITTIRLLTTLNTKGGLPDGQKLSAKLSPEGLARLTRVATKAGVSMAKLDRMKPWRAEAELAIARREGTLKPGPIEQYVIATASGASRHAFRNLEDDLKAIAAAPESEQIANLERALVHDDTPTANRRYAEAWAAGDLNWVERERAAPFRIDAPTLYQHLHTEPHAKWADQIVKLSQGSKPALVVVEITNLVGPDGVPALLRKRGITVEGP